MAGPPRLPIHVGDYLKDTLPVSRVNWQHHGIYLLALMIAWNVPGCRLPDDPEWLARKFGCTPAEFDELVMPVLRTYFVKRKGGWSQKRLSKERNYVVKISAKQRARIKSRWDKEKETYRGITAVVPGSPSGNTPIPIPIPIPTQLTISRSKRARAADAALADFEQFWVLCPKKVGKGKARKAYQAALSKTSFVTIAEAMRRYAASRVGEDDQYTAHPATWLNAERWLDQPAGNGAGALSENVQAIQAVADQERENLKRMGVI